ncbi:DUF2634 domain-containing protein [Paenibacillus ginsengarvi]|uniref:DUF2634 domain-containing protein n=1 Tax=Paenibacillus ginsengarvi TaxID=400777 RepID=A0A3B0CKC5_9BACL|nr:DUF2634 domain-containing protein [Paenibacillus ginsengarvi]RKN85863.1 DUF2634 domain-containing protein [Paenibacillus ginsengarvi]
MIPQGSVSGNIRQADGPLPGKTYKLDYVTGRVIGFVDGIDAVRQSVFHILQTERFEYTIYSNNYGIELAGLLGKGPATVQSDLRRRIRKALLQDDRITDVTDFVVTVTGDESVATFTVITQYGNFTATQGG